MTITTLRSILANAADSRTYREHADAIRCLMVALEPLNDQPLDVLLRALPKAPKKKAGVLKSSDNQDVVRFLNELSAGYSRGEKSIEELRQCVRDLKRTQSAGGYSAGEIRSIGIAFAVQKPVQDSRAHWISAIEAKLRGL